MLINGYIVESAGYIIVIIIAIVLGCIAIMYAVLASLEYSRLEKENPKILDQIKF